MTPGIKTTLGLLLLCGQIIDKHLMQGCELKISGSTKNVPIFYSGESDHIVMPTSRTSGNGFGIFLEDQDSINVACPNTTFKKESREDPLEVQCDGKSLVNVEEGGNLKPSDLTCSEKIQETVQDMSETACGPEDVAGYIVTIGWTVEDDFIPQYKICHDSNDEHTYFESHVVYGAAIELRSKEKSRPSFKEGTFYHDIDIDQAYTKKSQKKLIKDMGIELLDKKDYMARGHLAPDADFVYESFQDATYYYFNAAPQWQSINNGNWKELEGLVREYASNTGKNLEIITGTYDQFMLPMNESSVEAVFLAQEQKLVPVPMYFWKVVYCPETESGLTFVSLNHPGIQQEGTEDGIPEEYDLCQDESGSLCEEAGWQIDNRNSADEGLMYCCSYEQLRASIKWIPEIENPSPELLTFKDPDS